MAHVWCHTMRAMGASNIESSPTLFVQDPILYKPQAYLVPFSNVTIRRQTDRIRPNTELCNRIDCHKIIG